MGARELEQFIDACMNKKQREMQVHLGVENSGCFWTDIKAMQRAMGEGKLNEKKQRLETFVH